jgi:Ca-activated chloride channel family protein
MAVPNSDDKKIGEGILLIRGKEAVLPLKKTDVWATVTGLICQVRVVQTFHNPYPETIEAIYVFPLPHQAAVHDLKMVVGDREIVADVREREEARRVYEDARDTGDAASLLEQERPNVFTVSVANIRPGEEIMVDLRYHEKLAYQDGEYRFVLPMVVAPRYCPPGTTDKKTDKALPPGEPVADQERITPPLLPPAIRSGHTIALELTIEAGCSIGKMKCLSHEVDIDRTGDSRVQVALRHKDEIPNKDFVFVYQLASATVATSFFTYRKAGDPGYFLAQIIPPAYSDKIVPLRREMVFVIDRSGSMGGTSIVQARKALKASLRALNPDDTFTIIPFDEVVEYFSKQAVAFTQEKLEEADRYIATIEARGGTEILPAMQAALALPKDAERLRMVVFLTDGAVGNEENVLNGVKQARQEARIYTFGIGSAVNRYLLDKMAEVGKGFVEYLLPQEDIEEAIRRFQNKISIPLWSDLEFHWQGVKTADVYPPVLPDLFLGEPVTVVGRFLAGGSGKLVVKARAAGKAVSCEMSLILPESDDRYPALVLLWARQRIAHLSDLEREDKKGKSRYRDDIMSLAITYRLASQYTSFVAVEKRKLSKGDGAEREKCLPIHMPTLLPEGSDYDTLLGQGAPSLAGGSNSNMPTLADGGNRNMTCSGSIAPGAIGMINFMRSAPASAPPPMFCKKAPKSNIQAKHSGSGAGGASAGSALPPPEQRPPDLPLAKLGELALRYLTRIQNADGSWGKQEECLLLTAAAIVAFANWQHTDRKGSYTTYLRRAVGWLKAQTSKSDEATLLIFWAMAVLTNKESGDSDVLKNQWPHIQNISLEANLYKTLKYYCIIEAENAGIKIEYPTVLGPAMVAPNMDTAEKFLESVLLNHFQQGSPAAGDLPTLIKPHIVTSGDHEGRVALPCGEAAATIGAALLFSWQKRVTQCQS